MKKNFKSGFYLSTALAVVATGSMATPALAADDTKADDSGFETIVVTATRREERLQDVPISITVFNQQQLNNANITNSADLAAYTPSLSADGRRGGQNSTFSIRGFTQEIRTAPSVGVFFADVVAPRGGSTGLPSGDGGGPGNLFDLQNVQVLKGPQGTLFGRNTTGGDLLLVPVKPTSEFGGYAEASYGNYDMWRLQGVVNAPLNDTMRVRIGADHQSRDGYLNNIGPGPKKLNDVNYTAVRASLVWDITPDIENYTIASYLYSNIHPGVPTLSGYDQSAIDRYNANPSARNALSAVAAIAARDQLERMGDGFYTIDSYFENLRNQTEQWQVINTTTWQASDNLTVKNIASYAEFRQKYSVELRGTDFITPLVPPITNSDSAGLPLQTGASNPSPSKYSSAQNTITEELQFQGRGLDGKLIWQAGAYMEISNPLATTGSLSPGDAYCPQPLTLDNVDQCVNPYALDGSTGLYGGGAALQSGWLKFRDYALYAQATYDLTDTLKLTGGFRYTWDKTIGMGENINYIFTESATGQPPYTVDYTDWQRCVIATASLADNCSYTNTQNSNAPTWLLEVQYSPTGTVMTYAKYSRGYRQGGPLPLAPPTLDTYEAEKVDTYEIGAKTSWRGAIPGSLDIAAFYNDFANQQLQIALTPCSGCTPSYQGGARTFTIVNAGSSRIYGVEVNASVSPFTGLRVDLAYSYLNSLLKEFDTVTAEALANAVGMTTIPASAQGEALPQTPKHKATVSLTYTLPIPQDYGRLSIGSTFAWTDRYLTSAPITPFTPRGAKNPYADRTKLLNFNINWAGIGGSPLDASVFVTNALNEKYVTWRTESSGYTYDDRGQPRMYGVRLRYNF